MRESSYSIIVHHRNNIALLRLVAAWMVLFGHSLQVYDDSRDVLLTRLGFDSTHSIGLMVLFVLGGYLVTASWQHCKSIPRFAANRALRIWPGLLLLLLLTVLVMGPMATRLSAHDYFSNPESWSYFKYMYFFTLQIHLPGVFTASPSRDLVNLSLWSFQPEVLCYVAVVLLGSTGLLRWYIVLPFALLLLAISCYWLVYPPPQTIFRLYPQMPVWMPERYALTSYYFWIGSFCFLIKEKIKFDPRIVLCMLVVAVMCWYIGPYGKALTFLSYPYIVMYLAFGCRMSLSSWFQRYDMSYGVYLYAYPFSQLYVYYIGIKYGFAVYLITLTLASLAMASLSWLLVERPALNLKRITLIRWNR